MKTKVVVAIIALVAIGGIALIWFIGLPRQAYVATNDNASPMSYTIRLANNQFMEVDMSANETLVQTDYETFYTFEKGSLSRTFVVEPADLVSAPKHIYGRPGSFCYRVFDDKSVIKVSSDISTYQGFNALMTRDPYELKSDISKLKKIRDNPPAPFVGTTFSHIDKEILGNPGYNYNSDTSSGFIWYGAQPGEFYKAYKSYGLLGDVTNTLISTIRACYRIDVEEYYAGKDFYLFITDYWIVGIRRLNRNTQLVVSTNSVEQFDAAIATIMGSEWR